MNGSLRKIGLKYKFILITIATIVFTTLLGSMALHYLITAHGGYSPWYLVALGGIYILVGIAGTLLISRFMIQPVILLTEKIHQVKQGNLDVSFTRKPDRRWSDELDRLFEGFDHMVRHLKQTIEALTQAKEEAEQASQELFKSKSRLEAIFNGISDGIMILDRDFRIVGANPVIEQFMGRSLAEVMGKHCYEMCNGTLQRCSFCRADITFDKGIHASSYCTKKLGELGEERILEINDFPLYDESGQIVQIIEYVKDVTEAVNMQARLDRSRRLAEIGEMAAKVAHEVRNPLNAIRGATHYLSREIPRKDLHSYLELIEEQVDRMNHLTSVLLEFSRPVPPAHHPASLNKVVEHCLQLLHPRLSAKRIQVNTRLASDLPPVLIDEYQMEQVLVNLISNAIDALEEGGQLHIESYRKSPGNGFREEQLVMVVRDNGQGIDTGIVDKIFNPFFTTKARGTGLGLAIVKKIVDYHQGKIDIQSYPGEGTEIQISLPVRRHLHEETRHHIGG